MANMPHKRPPAPASASFAPAAPTTTTSAGGHTRRGETDDDWFAANWDDDFFVRLDVRLQSLWNELDSGKTWLEKSLAAKELADDLTATSSGERNKLLHSRWRDLWHVPGRPSGVKTPPERLGLQPAERLVVVLHELMRLVMEGTDDTMREHIVGDLRRPLREYLSLRGLAVQRAAAVDVTANARPEIAKAEHQSSQPKRLGFLGGAALADALGVDPLQREQFLQQLGRKRRDHKIEGDWREVQNSTANDPKFLYRAESPTVRELAARYARPKSV
jgi:hypothetical protein